MKEQPFLLKFRWLRIISVIFLFQNFGYSQNSITVIDENELPMIGVHINYAGINQVSDENGEIILETGLNPNTIFNFQYIAYEELSLPLRQILKKGSVVQLIPDNNLLEEIIIVGRTNLRDIDLPFNVKRVNAEAIYGSNAQNSADALEYSGAAYVQRSQMGGGSPVVRGFEANKLLLVIDGVRMNNAIYRNGHLQNAITIDPSMLQQMEVIYGPGSLMYGSEALGGVIHFRSKSPDLIFDDNPKHSLSAYTRFNSSNLEKTAHVHHGYSSSGFAVLTGLSYSDFSDLRSGKNQIEDYPSFGLRPDFVQTINGVDSIVINPDPFVQKGTAFSQFDFFQKWHFSLSDKVTLDLNLQHSNSSDIPRYDNLTERQNGQLRYATWNYGPQVRTLVSPKLSWYGDSPLFDKALLIVSYQNIKEDRISRRFNDPIEEEQNEIVDVYGATLDFDKRISGSQNLMYGLDYHYNKVNSSAFGTHIGTGESNPILSRYPSGGSSMANLGIYVNHRLQNRDSTLVWTNGLRWSHQNVSFNYLSTDPFIWPSNYYDGITNKNDALIGISGFNYNINNWLIKLSTGTAFRSPNVDDLAKIRVNNNELTVPNVDLKSEKVWNTELTLAYKTGPLNIALTGFYTRLSDAIVRSDFTLPNGSDTYIILQDTLSVTANTNASKGAIKGISANVNWQINPQFHLFSSFSLLSGTSEIEGESQQPLGHIPPAYGAGYISYEQKFYDIKLSYRFNAWKHIEDFGGSVDNPELATIDGSPAWYVVNLETQWRSFKYWSLNLSLNNIFDRLYRPFSSGINGAGRHVVISLKYEINQ